MKKTKRVGLLDDLRGLLIILMVIYHFIFDITDVYSVSNSLLDIPFIIFSRILGASLFMIIAGIMCNYSRNNLKRGLIAFGIAMAITVITDFVIPSQSVKFGIIHFMGVSMIVYDIFSTLFKKIPTIIGIVSSFLLFLLTFHLPNGYLGFKNLFVIPLPSSLYLSNYYPFGFSGPSFASVDYYPIFPWIFMFFAGSFIGRLCKQGLFPNFFYKSYNQFFSYVGKHTLIIYIIHQPILYTLTVLSFQLFKGK
ncbi:MAG: heparan-alpha-glucosaminide N-acetyltransferase [Oscillospiraceae bacterium]